MNAGVIPRSLPEQRFPNEEVLLALALLEQEHDRDDAQPFRVREGDLELQKLLLERFIDTQNTGFYANSYTTKMGVGMSEFMKHLRVGIERLQQEIADQEAQLRRKARFLGSGPKSLGSNKRAAKMLLRINTAYTKCKHVGGSELVFPILFGHLCYSTHKCWDVWTKTAVWRALESWRRSIGSIHAVAPDMVAEPESIAHADRGGLALLP